MTLPLCLSRTLTLAVAIALCLQPIDCTLQAADFTLRDPAYGSTSNINLPTLGDTASDDLSPMKERKLGEQIMLQAREAGDVFDDDETNEYLNQFGANLIAHAPPSDFNFEFFAVNDPSINAFALPGGYIAIHTGLLIATQSESELASVMAHEMGHVIQRHIARKLGNQKDSGIVAMAAMVLAMVALSQSKNGDAGEAAMTAGQGYAIQNQLNFSREAEREADRVGFQILRDSHFDASAMATFFGRLDQATRLADNGAPAWLRTHPMTTDRMADIQNRDARKGSAFSVQRPDSLDFQLIRARVKVLQKPTVQGLIDARASLEQQLASGQYANEIAVRYGLALTLSRQNDIAGAQAELGRIHNMLPGKNAIVENLAIDMRQLAGDAAGSATIATAAQAAFPQSRMLAISLADALQQAGKHDEAIKFLRDRISLYRKEPVFYELLARSYAAMGNGMLEHKSMSENYFLRGSPTEALEQLQIARRYSNGDFYELSQIDARARELQAVIVERKKEEKENGRGG